MVYQDNKRVQTAEELRRMYNLDNLSKDRRAISNNTNSLTKVENEQNNILKSIIINVGDNLKNQGEISLWFFNGTPTLENSPTIDWATEEDKIDHLGDLYYDKDTGYVYIFEQIENEFIWNRKEDKSLIQAMALTNSEIDSIDNIRKVFFTTPTPPYDNGDWYINNGDLYICQISKNIDEIYSENDFIIAPKYTDDTKANEVAGNLTIVSGQVTTIIQNLEEIIQTIEDNRYYVDENGNKHLISTSLSQLSQQVDNITGTIQVTGGNNLIKDSQGILNDNVWNYYEKSNLSIFPSNNLYPSSNVYPIEHYYSESEYISGYDETLIGKTTAIAKIGVKNGKQTTSSENITGLVVGNMYTLSYKISNDANTVSKIRLIGNNNIIYEETINTEIDMEERVFSFIATTTKYTFEIDSSTILNGFVYVYDLMLNKGDVIPWEPAVGEIVSTVLKFSQLGLQVYCTGSEIATLMSAQGFEIRRFSNGTLYEIVTEFTKDGFISKKGILEQLEIGNFDFKTIMYQGYETLILYKKESE